MHLDYPGCNRLRIVSKDELSSRFYQTPSSWGDHQNTPCSGFTKCPRFLNIVMTFIFHPLPRYNSITESRAQFLLSLLEDIFIDFPSQFILSLIDVYRDTATCDKLIFPSAITWLLCHFSVSFLVSPYFSVMGTIDAATVRQNEAQLRPRWPQTQTIAPLASTVPSTSAPSSSVGGVTLETTMAQLMRMVSRVDTLNDELC